MRPTLCDITGRFFFDLLRSRLNTLAIDDHSSVAGTFGWTDGGGIMNE